MNRKYDIYEDDTKKFIKTEEMSDADARLKSLDGYCLRAHN